MPYVGENGCWGRIRPPPPPRGPGGLGSGLPGPCFYPPPPPGPAPSPPGFGDPPALPSPRRSPLAHPDSLRQLHRVLPTGAQQMAMGHKRDSPGKLRQTHKSHPRGLEPRAGRTARPALPGARGGLGRAAPRGIGTPGQAERGNPHLALLTAVRQHPSPGTGMGHSGRGEGDHAPRSTLETRGWRSPMEHRGLGFPAPWEPPGREEAAPSTGLQRQSCTWLSRTSWFRRIAPRRPQHLRSQAREGSIAPQQMLESPSPLPDGAAARQLSGGFADHTPQRGNQDPPQAAVRM
ncbi:uncharacterized protein LOC142364442 [Opisthocomus hoazin]|uniref:uncharacterized protein LOC142364442 n=1 Tax=Opisthocomus hoazin TaxID=30419 RepID=UPI003F5311BF